MYIIILKNFPLIGHLIPCVPPLFGIINMHVYLTAGFNDNDIDIGDLGVYTVEVQQSNYVMLGLNKIEAKCYLQITPSMEIIV